MDLKDQKWPRGQLTQPSRTTLVQIGLRVKGGNWYYFWKTSNNERYQKKGTYETKNMK